MTSYYSSRTSNTPSANFFCELGTVYVQISIVDEALENGYKNLEMTTKNVAAVLKLIV